MKKLDNKGWGLGAMIVYICIILTFLLVATYFIIVLYSDLKRDIKDNSEQEIQTNIDPQKQENLEVYDEYLEKIAKAAEIYFLNQSELLAEHDIVDIDDLVQNQYLDYLYDPTDNNLCSGYGKVLLSDEELLVKSFLKCSNYQSEGYEE